MKQIIFWFLPVLLLSSFLSFWQLSSVDIEASEDIYVADAVGYLRHDPFMVPRHHLRKPHYPASPHPFLVPFLTTEVFEVFGISIFTARFVQSFSVVLTTGVVMLLAFSLSRMVFTAVLSGLLFTTSPLVIRFGRMAVLDPVLMLVYAMLILWSWRMVKKRGVEGYIFAGLVGLSLGLAISTKLTGIFFVIPIGLLFMWQFLKTREKYFIGAGIICAFVCVTIFVLLNDPYSYYYGWTHFSDPKHSRISLSAILRAVTTVRYWFYFVTGLIGVPAFAIFLIALGRFKNIFASTKRIFLFSWILGPLTYLVINPIHVTGLSAEWSYLPIMVPFSIILSMTIATFRNKAMRHGILICYFLFTIPVLCWYGLRFKQLPLAQYLRARNVVMGDSAVTNILTALNKEKEESLVLVVTKGIDFPLWLVSDNLHTEPFYHLIEEYDYIVTDNQDMRKKAEENNFANVRSAQNPSEPMISLFKNRENNP